MADRRRTTRMQRSPRPGSRTAARGMEERNELHSLYEITAVVGRSNDVETASKHITAALCKHTAFTLAALERFDLKGAKTELVGWCGPALSGRLWAASILPASRLERLRRKRQPAVLKGIPRGGNQAHPAFVRSRVRTLVTVPVRTDGTVWGALTVGAAESLTVSPGMRRLLSTLATEISWLVARRASEEALRAAAEQYRHLFDNALDAIFILDPSDWTILDVNLQAQLLTGARRNSLVGSSIIALAPGEEVEVQRAAYGRLAAEKELRNLRSTHIRNRKGRLLAVEVNARLVPVGNKLLAISVVRDITAQKKAEVQLSASEELLRIIVEGTLDMFFYVHNTAGVFTYVSPSVTKITGHSVQEWMKHYDQFATDNPVNRRMRELTERTLATGVVSSPYPCEIHHADGRRILLEINERPILRDGSVIGIQGVARDVTERKRLEEQLIQSQKMESIGLLAGGIAHDFNNILGGILGYASYLKSVVPTEDTIYQHLDTIERSALRAADLTSKLLAFARGGKYVVKPININAVVEETLRLLRGSLDRDIVIQERLARDLPAIEADGGQIQQVVMNLCVNARDAMPGGGRLIVSTAIVPWQTPFLLSQPDVRHTRYVRISVEDTGVGIEASILGKIFDPFFTTKEKGKGTGLGLATVYGIVKNHSGFIDLQSRIGTGTAFHVYFPSVEQEAVGVEEKIEKVSGGSETVLVVDDEEVIRRLVIDLLQAKGYRVLEAGNGREALAIYEQERGAIDLVILDMVMPDMGGRETFVHLRELNGDVRTILSTGYAEDERARELMAMGVKAFVQKPYRAEELASVVRSVLDNNPGRS